MNTTESIFNELLDLNVNEIRDLMLKYSAEDRAKLIKAYCTFYDIFIQIAKKK